MKARNPHNLLAWIGAVATISCVTFSKASLANTHSTIKANSDTTFYENWESGIGNWYVDQGVWEVGKPAAGPSKVYSGQNCAGTILAGNYPHNASTRLISPQITLPNLSAGEKLQLKFWHWFRNADNWGSWDKGTLQIKVGSGNWESISIPFWGTSPVWTQVNADISAYAGKTVRIAFYFTSDGGGREDKGWYVDDISIVRGVGIFNNPENFEQGVGDWSADNGLWEVGKATVGPSSAHSGQNCAGTILGGNYTSNNDTRLISPPVNLPNLSTGEQLQLKVWHWFRTSSENDKGFLQIKVGSADWENIAGPFIRTSPVWTQLNIDISARAGKTVRIAFYFTSDGGWEDNGWYVDDLSITKKVVTLNNPENFEQGVGDWSAESGLWEVGKPTAGLPSAHSLQNCAGTILAGNYPHNANTRLISPQITLPNLSAGEKLQLKFWHWFRNADNWGSWDEGTLQIKVGSGEWESIASPFWGTSPVWTQVNIDISAYAGRTVRIAFYFTSDGGGREDVGWYVDDISIVKGVVTFNNPEDFERGVSDWSADNGLWEVGKPTVGPTSTHSGQNCAGTILGGNYTSNASTRLISQEITLTSREGFAPELFFWHWFRTQGLNDKGVVQIKVSSGDWVDIAGPYSGTSPVWSQGYIDLSAYADKTIRLAFQFISDGGGEDNGWYIDDIRFTVYNYPPIVKKNIPDITFAEDTGPHTIVANLDSNFTDPDGTLTYKAYSDNTNIQASIQGQSLIANSSQDYFGSGHVKVTATDNGGKSVSDTFRVVITSVNDPPKLNLPDSIAFRNDSYVAINLWESASDVETPDSLLSYACRANTTSLITSYNKRTGELTLNAPGYVGSCHLYVSAVDDSNAAAYDTVRVIVKQATRVDDRAITVPTQYELSQNYPNPFNALTRFRFALPKAEKVKVEVYNLHGENVATLLNTHLPAGYHEISFDAGELASGVFYYRIEAGEFVQVRKMILIK